MSRKAASLCLCTTPHGFGAFGMMWRYSFPRSPREPLASQQVIVKRQVVVCQERTGPGGKSDPRTQATPPIHASTCCCGARITGHFARQAHTGSDALEKLRKRVRDRAPLQSSVENTMSYGALSLAATDGMPSQSSEIRWDSARSRII